MEDSTHAAKKIENFLLEQQLPKVSNGPKSDSVTTVDHVTQIALETCHCVHLQEYLPHVLDLQLCKARKNPRGWVVANPVHSLHLTSQLEDASPSSTIFKEPTILYGEEQQRTNALHAELMLPLDGHSAGIDDDAENAQTEYMPTMDSVHKVARPPASPTSSNLVAIPSPSETKVVPVKSDSSTVKSSADVTPSNTSQVKNTSTTKPEQLSTNEPLPLNDASISRPSPESKVAPTETTNPPPSKDVAAVTTITNDATTEPYADKVASETITAINAPSPYELPDPRYHHLRLEEDRIGRLRSSLASHRLSNKKKMDSKKTDSKKKRKKDSDIYMTRDIPGWRAPALKELDPEEEDQWNEAAERARAKIRQWIDHYRLCRRTYWDERKRLQERPKSNFYLPKPTEQMRSCQICTTRKSEEPHWSVHTANKGRRLLAGDNLMQCLDCGFVGCSPKTLCNDSRQHMLQHLLISGHQFAVTCGERAQLYCFSCGDFVYHEVFHQEKERIDYTEQLHFMAWKEAGIQRSFDPFQFMRTREHGIVWRGPIATYPHLVPREHVRATMLVSRRQALFEGRVHEKWMIRKSKAMVFAAFQCLLDDSVRYRIAAPVGMYNLGNTCFKSAILQCLLHCQPLQRYFLKDMGHHHQACKLYRENNETGNKKKNNGNTVNNVDDKPSSKLSTVCLACEMDRLFLSNYGSTVGKDVSAAIQAVSPSSDNANGDEVFEGDDLDKGMPLIISDFLTATWKSGGMDHLAGYEQRDAHEFLNSFLDMLGKHSYLHRERVYASITSVKEKNALVSKPRREKDDIVKRLFEGTLRSLCVCEECGGKRTLNEAFMNISLTLSEEVERLQFEIDASRKKLSVERCLQHFVLPEKLGDGVYCPACKKKTPTKKQHTFAKLPKVLCLHLKRFDATRNKKIDEFVSFPARGLNMGNLLSHWCEVTRVQNTDKEEPQAEPQIMYDLYATVNHQGNMQSGHYVANIKVNEQWYHCNDAHISRLGPGDGEEEVMKNEGAYLLFYTRR